MSSDAGAASVDSFDFELYRYTPSLPAAIVSVAIFAVLTAVHVWRMLRARAFYFTPFVIGGIRKFLLSQAPQTLCSGQARAPRF